VKNNKVILIVSYIAFYWSLFHSGFLLTEGIDLTTQNGLVLNKCYLKKAAYSVPITIALFCVGHKFFWKK